MHHGAVELVAYVVASGQLDVTELRTHVASALPHYMVPSAFVFIDEFPLTPNGKIDRNALPEPEATPQRARERVAPRDPLEAQLAAIWEDALGVAAIGVELTVHRAEEQVSPVTFPIRCIVKFWNQLRDLQQARCFKE